MSIRSGTDKILALIAHEVAVAQADITEQTRPRIAALEDQCRILKDSLAVAQQGLQNAAQNSDDASKASTRLHILQNALDKSGLTIDYPSDTIRFGPMFSTLAHEVARIAGVTLEGAAESLLQSSISGLGIFDLLQTVKRSLEENQKMLNVWKYNCEAVGKERDEFKEAASKAGATILSKETEIDNLRNELLRLNNLQSTKRPSPNSRKRSKPDDESSDSDVPLATSSKRYPPAKPSNSTSPPSPKRQKVDTSPVLLSHPQKRVQAPSPSRSLPPADHPSTITPARNLPTPSNETHQDYQLPSPSSPQRLVAAKPISARTLPTASVSVEVSETPKYAKAAPSKPSHKPSAAPDLTKAAGQMNPPSPTFDNQDFPRTREILTPLSKPLLAARAGKPKTSPQSQPTPAFAEPVAKRISLAEYSRRNSPPQASSSTTTSTPISPTFPKASSPTDLPKVSQNSGSTSKPNGITASKAPLSRGESSSSNPTPSVTITKRLAIVPSARNRPTKKFALSTPTESTPSKPKLPSFKKNLPQDDPRTSKPTDPRNPVSKPLSQTIENT